MSSIDQSAMWCVIVMILKNMSGRWIIIGMSIRFMISWCYQLHVLRGSWNNAWDITNNIITSIHRFIYCMRSSVTPPSQNQQQKRSRNTMVDYFYSSIIKPHFSYQNNNIKWRHNTLRNASTCTSIIKTQQNSITPSRGRGKFRSSPHYQNNLRNTNSISPTAYRSQIHIPLVLSSITISTDTDKNQYSNINNRPLSSVSNLHFQSTFHVFDCNSNYRSTFSNNTCNPSRPRSRSQSLPRSPPLSSTPPFPHLLSLEIPKTKNTDLHQSSVKQTLSAKPLDPSLNYPSPTNTIEYKKDKNIAQKTDTVQFKKTSEIHNLVPTRTNNSLISVRSLVSDSIPTHSHTPQQICTTPSTEYSNYSVDRTTSPRSTNVSKTLSSFYSRYPRPPA